MGAMLERSVQRLVEGDVVSDASVMQHRDAKAKIAVAVGVVVGIVLAAVFDAGASWRRGRPLSIVVVDRQRQGGDAPQRRGVTHQSRGARRHVRVASRRTHEQRPASSLSRSNSEKLSSMNRFQRHVLVVALGAACIVIGVAVNRLFAGTASGGWFMYAPGSDVPFEPSSSARTTLRTVAVWFAVIGAWAAVAFRIYRSTEESET